MKRKIEDIDKKQVFNTPEGYFEDLPMRIQARIESEKPQAVSKRLPKWSLALASVALLLTFVFVLYDSGTSEQDLLAGISQEELVAYLDQIELDEYEIASTFESDLDALNLDETSVLDGIDMENEALEDVLLEYDLGDEFL